MGRHDEAISAAARGLAVDSDYVPALVEMAVNYIDKKEYRQAAGLLGEASMVDANDPSIYLLRAWLHENFLNQPVAARGFNEQALGVEGYGDTNVKSLRGFALLNLDRPEEGDAWMSAVLSSQPDNDGLINYYGACYYALRGNEAKALECVEASLKAGYSDDHNWMKNNDGQVNAAALRDNLRFLNLMNEYNSIFGK